VPQGLKIGAPDQFYLRFASKVSKTFNAHNFVPIFGWNHCLPHTIRGR
jgi:hypothetical protein